MPIQPGPLSIQAIPSTRAGSRSRAARTSSARPGSTSPERTSGGAANASRAPRRTVTSPTPHS